MRRPLFCVHPLALALTVVAVVAFVLSVMRGVGDPLPAVALDWPLLLHVERAVGLAGLTGVVGVVWLRTSRGELPSRIGPGGVDWPTGDVVPSASTEDLLRVDHELRTAFADLAQYVEDALGCLPDARPASQDRVREQLGRLDEAIGDAERKDRIAAAIRRLPEYERLVVALHYYEGMTFEDIAHALEVPVGQVRQLEAAARRELKADLGRPVGPDDFPSAS